MFVQQASEHGAQSHHLEIRSANHSRAYLARIAQSHHGEANGGEVAELANRLHRSFQVMNFRNGKHGIRKLEPRRALPDVNQPILVAVHQRAQQHPTHQAEDRRVRANAQRQRQNDGDRQPLRPPQRPKRHSQVLQD